MAMPDGDLPLTGRELEILKLTAAGFTNGDIARRLWVTEQTVKFHLRNVYRKLNVTNRTQASHIAYVKGIGWPPAGGVRCRPGRADCRLLARNVQ